MNTMALTEITPRRDEKTGSITVPVRKDVRTGTFTTRPAMKTQIVEKTIRKGKTILIVRPTTD